MRTLAPLAVALLVLLGATPSPAAPEGLLLEAGATVDGLRLADVDHDGLEDLLLLEGRRVRIWRGRAGALPPARPDWDVRVEDGVSFVDVKPEGAAALLTLGTGGLAEQPLVARAPNAGAAVRVLEPAGLGWRGAERAVFAPLGHASGALVAGAGGVALRAWDGTNRLQLPLGPYRDVASPGPFLEDTAVVVAGIPAVFVGRSADAGPPAPALWALDGPTLVAASAGRTVRYDLSFLSGDGAAYDQTLVDLDGDGRPDVLHRIHDNREARYGFFHTRPAPAEATGGPSHKPVASTLVLSGFQLEPDLVDLDGDGLRDLVITSMQVNAANMIGALTSGKVTAETRAFRNRWAEGKGTYFESEPDALVKSQIDVKVRFNYAGNIEVVRSFLILLDGDYDGDGRRDLAIRTGPESLTIRRGTATGIWAGDAEARTVALPPPGGSPSVEGHAADLDGDGRDEIVLVLRAPPGGGDRVRILDPGS